MIIDKIENAKIYAGISKSIARGLDILNNIDLSLTTDVKHNEEDLFYMLQRYQTGPAKEPKIEAHKQYIDIQYVVSGEEILQYSPITDLNLVDPYNEQKDVAFYKTPANINEIILTSGMFCILFPQDGHNLRIQVNEPKAIFKVLIKVKI